MAWALSAASVLGVVGVRVLHDRETFMLWDRVDQYAATYHYIGEQLRSGNFPVLVPWQGSSANLLLDAQYGLMSPIYLAQNWVFSMFSDLAAGTILLVAAYLLILQSGTFAWVLRLSRSPRWAAMAGLAAPLAGYVFWWSSWHPALVANAFLPWLGWSLAKTRPGRAGTAAIVLTGYACFAAGWPVGAVAAFLIVFSSIVEALVRGRTRDAGLYAAATAASGLLAAPTVLFTAAALDWTMRSSTIANTNFMVPNLADVLNSWMPSAAVNMNFFGSAIDTEPTMLAVGFGLVVVPLIAWRPEVWRRSGMLTVACAAGLALVLTQGPSDFGPLRWPVRFLGLWQISLVVLLAAAAGVLGVKLTRGRLLTSAAFLAAGAFITVSRTPYAALDHLLSVLLAIAFVAAFSQMNRRSGPWLMGLAMALMSISAIVQQPTSDKLWPRIPTELSAYQEPLAASDERVLVLFPDNRDYLSRIAQGVFPGQNVLLSPSRAGLGYTSIGQEPLQSRMCTAVQGWSCPEVFDFLATREPLTGADWLDLLGIDTLVVERSFLERAQASGALLAWRTSRETADFVVLERETPTDLPGRLTYIEPGVAAAVVEESDTTQKYRIDSGAPSLVVVSDVFWPGYRATWNGQEVPVQALDDSLVSVEVPAGQGELTVTYQAAGTYAALVAVGLGLTIAASVIFWSGWRRETGDE